MPRKNPPIPDTPETPVKATDAEILQRVATVHKLLVAGASRASIQQYAIKAWGLSESPVDVYIARAKESIKEQTDRDKENNLSMALARMNDIYQQCISAKNYKGAITAQVEINKLLGLYAPTKTEGTGENGAFVIKLVRETGFNPQPTISESDE
jgi:hypothetical protein